MSVRRDQQLHFRVSKYEQSTGRSQKNNVIAYQIRQSFKPGEITPEEANKVGYEWMAAESSGTSGCRGWQCSGSAM